MCVEQTSALKSVSLYSVSEIFKKQIVEELFFGQNWTMSKKIFIKT